jgi:hypothetical protein
MATEKRLIYLEDAKKALIGWETDATDEEIEWTLDQLPKVDAVEVVRCKDCKAYDKEAFYCEAMGFTCEANDFCSYGERKDNGI